MNQEQLSIGQMVKYFIYGTLIVMGFGVIYFWLSFGAATINVVKNDGITNNANIQAVHPDGKAVGMLHVGDFYLIPRTAKSIQVSAGSYTTLSAVKSLPYFGSTTLSVALFKDRNASKVASDAPGCLSYGGDTKRIISYDCTSPTYLLHFDPITWQNIEVEDVASNTLAMEPYRGGVIGILIGGETDRPIFTVSPQGETSYIQKPGSLDDDVLSSTSVITDKSSHNTHFVLQTRSGIIYYGNHDGTYKKLNAPNNYSAEFDSMLCSLVLETLYCYYGPSSDSEDSAAAIKHREKNPTGYFETINLSSNERQSIELDGEGVDSVAVSQDGHVYGLGRGILYSLKEPNQKPERFIIDTGVVAISAGEDLYFSKGDTLYKSRNLQSYKVFSSDNVRLSSIFTIDDTVLFNAYLKKESALNTETLHTFQLTDEVNNGKLRLVDILPVKTSYYLVSSDFYQKSVRLQIAASVISDRATGVTAFDEQEYETNKTAAVQALQALGIYPTEYSFVFAH